MDSVTDYDYRIEQIFKRLDMAIQANMEKYPDAAFDFTHSTPTKNEAFCKLREAIHGYGIGVLLEQEVKPVFIVWIKVIKA